MNGKDIFLGLKYVGSDLIEKAEFSEFSSQAEPAVPEKRRQSDPSYEQRM